MRKTLLITITLFISIIGYSQTFTENNITYQVTSTANKTVRVNDYNTAGAADINIPSSVIDTSVTPTITYFVTEIFQGSFDQKNLNSVVISNTVSSIGQVVFSNNQLISVTIPSNVTTIGNYVFQGNPLTSVTSLATTPPTITKGSATDSFNTDRTNIDLTIPTGTLGTYVTDPGALWIGFKTVTEDAALSTSNFKLANAIKIVPTANEIRIISNNNVVLKKYAVYTISGIRVATGKESKIPTNYLPKGIYILKLDFNTGVFTKKIIIN
jgi:hypothetical protein